MKLAVFKKHFPVFLFCYHLLFAYVAWAYILENNGDAVRYWFVGQDLSQKSWFSFFQPGTDVIKLITFPLVKFLHLPFWSGFLLFSLFSYMGFYRLWKTILALTQHNTPTFLLGVLLLLLPNLHLWTSFIGKESLLFVALVGMTEKVLQQHIQSKAFIASFLLIALIRPHVAFILLISLLLALFWKGGLSLKAKGWLSGFAAFCLLGLYLVLKKIAFMGPHPWERILHLYDVHIKVLRLRDAYVPLDRYPLPYKLFTFYYRPLPFEKTGWLYKIWSFENFILLMLSCALLYVMVRNFKRIKWDLFEIFTIFALVLMATMYVYAYANYGLIARTKIMVMPFFYVLMVRGFSQSGRRVRIKDGDDEMRADGVKAQSFLK